MHFAETMAQFQGLLLSRENEEQQLEVTETA
jgi:hypothetical protein